MSRLLNLYRDVPMNVSSEVKPTNKYARTFGINMFNPNKYNIGFQSPLEPYTINPNNGDNINTDDEPAKKTMWENLKDEQNQQKLFGIGGYAMQGISALNDYVKNSQQPDIIGPSRLIANRIGYRPVDVEPYNRKMDQSVSGYKKYLMETGNANMIGGVVGNAMDKTNEFYAQTTDANNKGVMQVDQFNASSASATDAQNAQLEAEYQKMKMADKAYKDAATKSNKATIFGSVAGIGKTLASNSSQSLKLDVLSKMFAKGENDKIWNALFNKYNNQQNYVNTEDITNPLTEV